MINLAVINLKDIFKNLLKLLGIGLILIFIINGIPKISINNNVVTISFLEKCFNMVLPVIDVYSNEDVEKNGEIIALSNILELEMPLFTFLEEKNVVNQTENVISKEINQENIITEEIPENMATEVISEKNLTERATNEYSTVKIKNETDYELTEDILNPNITLNSKDILIFHTHTCESYTSSESYSYVPTGNYRTTDLSFSVARVGDELEKYLCNYGYSVVHDKSYHDYPAYTGSYDRSIITVKNLLSKYQNTDIVIDLHRDAIGDNTYAPKVKIGEEYCARLMLVIGTDGGGLTHDNWRENLKIAIKLQQKANELYPGLFKPIIVRNSRYNHQVSKGACIIEVGATGNTLEECLNSMKYLSKIYDEI